MDKKQLIVSTAKQNLSRVMNLIVIYENNLLGQGRGRRPVSSGDVLRAAVVLLHAALEDFLRSIAEWKIPMAEKGVLDKIPLTGQKGRPDKFLLGDLVRHRGKRVEQIFKESVDNYLERSNYNNITELRTVLEDSGIDSSRVSHHFNKVNKVMLRRHNIVHRVDKNDAPGRGHHRAKPINHRQVRNWVSEIGQFIDDVAEEI